MFGSVSLVGMMLAWRVLKVGRVFPYVLVVDAVLMKAEHDGYDVLPSTDDDATRSLAVLVPC